VIIVAKPKKKRSGIKAVLAKRKKAEGDLVKYICRNCKREEDIPREVVEYNDIIDDGDISVPPMFDCEECGTPMEPLVYTGVHGITYKYKIDD
jgi:hypothetical protein